jgi:hypothetical protein
MADKLDIKNEMRQFDLKNRNFYDELSDEEKKKFAPFLMIRWGSALYSNNSDLQAYYLMSTNKHLNKDFFSINGTQHKKLQWLIATTVSPGKEVLQTVGGIPNHQWISNKKPKDPNSKAMDFLRGIHPHLKDDELKLMVEINDRADIENLAREHGWDDKRIKSDL